VINISARKENSFLTHSFSFYDAGNDCFYKVPEDVRRCLFSVICQTLKVHRAE
jgi:hypothetical protein